MVSADWVVRYDNRFFQLEPQSRNYAPARSQVLVCEGRHGAITIEYRGQTLRFREIPAPRKPPVLDAGEKKERLRLAAARTRKWVPPRNHPWREAARRGAQQKAQRETPLARPLLASPCASP